MTKLPPALLPALPPVAILLAAALLLWVGPALPPSLAGLKEAAAYFVLLAGAGMGLWFNRGRAFVAAVSLLLAYAGYRFALDYGADSFTARAVYTAVVVLVPLNVAGRAAAARARRVLPRRLPVAVHRRGRDPARRLDRGLGPQHALGARPGRSLLEHWLLRSPPAPLLGRLLFGAAIAVAAVERLGPHYSKQGGPVSPLAAGIAGALLAFFIACEWAAQRGRVRRLHGRRGRDPGGVHAAGIAPPRLQRRAHRAAGPARAAGGDGERWARTTRSPWPTWTTSRPSTTRTATTSATRCSSSSRRAWPRSAAAGAPSATAARSSRCCSPTRTARRGAAAPGGAARLGRVLPHGGARRGPAEEEGSGREAARAATPTPSRSRRSFR